MDEVDTVRNIVSRNCRSELSANREKHREGKIKNPGKANKRK
jgi:hypothetical protein